MPAKKKLKKETAHSQLIKNQRLILKRIEDIEKNLKRQQFIAYLRFIVLAIPLILGLLLLIPAFQTIVTTYQELIEILTDAGILKAF